MHTSTQVKSRVSFFDDNNLQPSFQFIKPQAHDQNDLDSPATIRDFLTLKDPSDNQTKQGFYALHNKLLAYYKSESIDSLKCVLNLTHSKLKYLPADATNSEHGFEVTKNGSSFEFYSPDKQTIDNWMMILRSFCVVSDFHEEFKAIKMIGQGSFAKVYLAESRTNRGKYAVKAFSKEGIISQNKSNSKSVLVNEIDILRSLDHENIIKLYEVHETENSIYLILDLIQGNSLEDILKRPSLRKNYSTVQFKDMIRSILDALAYLASKGIMHRDLKPDNILVEKDGKIKIVDFGLATYIGLSEYIYKKCGTPGYIAPEVFKYNPKIPTTSYNDRCDVFSAGCILFFIFFGYPFIDGCSDSDTLHQNKSSFENFEAYFILDIEMKNQKSKINKEGLNLLWKLLEFEHENRISATDAFGHPYFLQDLKGLLKMSSSQELSFKPLNQHNRVQTPSTSDTADNKSLKDEPNLQVLEKHRFTEKDSLYLDVGKPELNGKLDTITLGSANNSISVNSSISNTTAPTSTSTFGKPEAVIQQKGRAHSRSFKTPGTFKNNQSFLKAAIFRNMQKNNGNAHEEAKNSEIHRRKFQRQFSESVRRKPSDLDEFSDKASSGSENSENSENSGEFQIANDEDQQVQIVFDNMNSQMKKQSGKFL
jgi:serine/threonine protein kinase